MNNLDATEGLVSWAQRLANETGITQYIVDAENGLVVTTSPLGTAYEIIHPVKEQ